MKAYWFARGVMVIVGGARGVMVIVGGARGVMVIVGGARGVMVNVIGNVHGDTSSNLDAADCISHSTNTLGKSMNPIILPPAMGK